MRVPLFAYTRGDRGSLGAEFWRASRGRSPALGKPSGRGIFFFTELDREGELELELEWEGEIWRYKKLMVWRAL